MTLNRAAARKKAVRARRRRLEQEHYNLLDWLMCVEDNIVLGNDDEATDIIKKLSGYAEKLAVLVGERRQKHIERLAREKDAQGLVKTSH